MATLEEIQKSEIERGHVRLFVEEIFCEVMRMKHAEEVGCSPEQVQIWRNVHLGEAGSYADVYVQVPGGENYYVEVKFGMSERDLIDDLERALAG